MKKLFFSVSCLALAALAVPQVASAAAIVNKTITVDGQNVGTLNVASPTVFTQAPSTGGLTISASFAGNYPPLDPDCELMWVQMISTTNPLNTATPANTPYFDPGELDNTGDKDPFYWNTALKANDGNDHPEFYYVNKQFAGGTGTNFFDQPKRTFTGPAINWAAELSLVLWHDKQKEFSILWTGTYGFKISTAGIVTVQGATELAAPVWLTQTVLTAKFPGWTIGDPSDCIVDISAVPEPSSFLIMSLGIGILAVRRLQKKCA